MIYCIPTSVYILYTIADHYIFHYIMYIPLLCMYIYRINKNPMIDPYDLVATPACHWFRGESLSMVKCTFAN